MEFYYMFLLMVTWFFIGYFVAHIEIKRMIRLEIKREIQERG